MQIFYIVKTSRHRTKVVFSSCIRCPCHCICIPSPVSNRKHISSLYMGITCDTVGTTFTGGSVAVAVVVSIVDVTSGNRGAFRGT